mmetsp:Transcript_63146/g.73899  ORF Transcript_63146/g.73899 Transcript_63146/m.73899 type:complete len:84 (+) Transcript_63146:141-392(+)
MLINFGKRNPCVFGFNSETNNPYDTSSNHTPDISPYHSWYSHDSSPLPTAPSSSNHSPPAPQSSPTTFAPPSLPSTASAPPPP